MKTTITALILGLSMVVAACGGGGSDPPPAATNPDPTPVMGDSDTTESLAWDEGTWDEATWQ